MAKGQAKGQGKQQASEVIKYEKLMTQFGSPMLLIQGHIYHRNSKKSKTYSCKSCTAPRARVNLEDGKILKAKLRHSNDHAPPSKAKIAKLRFNLVRHEYFKDKKNFEKLPKDICEDILKNHSLQSLGFKDEDKLASSIYKFKWELIQNKHKTQKRSLPEISDNEEDETMPENEQFDSEKMENDSMPENSSDFQETLQLSPQANVEENSSDFPSENEILLPQTKIESDLPMPEDSNDLNISFDEDQPMPENSSDFNAPSQVQNSIGKLKFFINEINESLLPSNVSSSKLLSIKNLGDVRFYLSKISEQLANSSNSMSSNSMASKTVGKAKFFVLEISELLNKNGEGLVSIKDFEDIKFYMKKISKLMDENVQSNSSVQENSVEIPIFID